MRSLHIRIGGAFFFLSLMGTVAPAALLEYEGFDYSGSAINGLGGGMGWGDVWLDGDGDFAFLSDDDVSLDSPAFPFTPIGDRISGPVLEDPPPGGSGEGVRALGTTASLSDEGTVWYMSGLFRKGGTDQSSSENIEFSITSATTSSTQRIRWGMGSDDGTGVDKFFVDIGASPTTYGLRTTLPNVTYFLVAKLITHASESDELYLWVYGPDDTVPADEPDIVLADVSVAEPSNADLGALRLVIGKNNHLPEIDELRIGETWADAAVPEPSGLLLGLLGTGAWLVRRRIR